jgi:3-oxoadipate enol-lactonase
VPGLDVGGARIDYDIAGQDGPLAVQLHGLTSCRARDAAMGLNLGQALHHNRVLRYDARGHGESSGDNDPSSYTWPALAGDLLQILDELAPGESVHAVGTSMGTGTLLHAALRDPGRFASLTLVLPPTAWETRRAKSVDYLANAELVQRDGIDAFVSASDNIPDPPALAGTPHSRPAVAEDLLPTVLRGAAASNLPALQSIAEVSIPTLILAWVQDPSHPLRTAELLHRTISSSRLVVAASPGDVLAWPGLFVDHVATA